MASTARAPSRKSTFVLACALVGYCFFTMWQVEQMNTHLIPTLVAVGGFLLFLGMLFLQKLSDGAVAFAILLCLLLVMLVPGNVQLPAVAPVTTLRVMWIILIGVIICLVWHDHRMAWKLGVFIAVVLLVRGVVMTYQGIMGLRVGFHSTNFDWPLFTSNGYGIPMIPRDAVWFGLLQVLGAGFFITLARRRIRASKHAAMKAASGSSTKAA